MKKLLLVALSAAMFFACTKGDDNQNTQDEGKNSFLSLKFPTLPTPVANSHISRAPTEGNGTEDDSKMDKARVLLFDQNNKCLGSVEYTSSFTGGTITESKEVPPETKKVFVVINAPTGKWNLSSDAVINKTWSEINSEIKAVTADDIATNTKFVMSNAGDNTKGALIDVVPFETHELAIASPYSIVVDRMCARIKVTHPTSIPSPNATFTFSGWQLNTVNLATALYTERISGYPQASTGTPGGLYRQDHNYISATFPPYSGLIAYTKYLTDNYSWLKNEPTVSEVALAKDQTIYCTENTMDADGQQWGHTTKVVVKGVYTPNSITAGASYFAYKSTYYSVADLKIEFVKPEKAALKTDLVTFLKEAFGAGTIYGDLSETDKAVDANIIAAIDALDAYSGIKARYKAVMYYHNSVCYYDALIRHDDNVTDLMALARYGVVRNNSYEINVSKVNGPGTPWIPDPTDPEDPTKPTDPDDEKPSNLSITVTVKKWTLWTHDVELGK